MKWPVQLCFNMRDLLIFDCDGTLVDTLQDVALCFNAVLSACGFPTYPLEAYGGFVGGNLETIVSRLLPEKERTGENIERVKMLYRERYGNSPKENTRPYDGIPQTLNRLKALGFLLAVNTNKGQKLTDDLLNRLFPHGMFAAVVGYEETRPSKPDPFGVDMICSACGRERGQAVYIGDGHSDIETARNAGIPLVFAAWGQGSPEDRSDPGVFAAADSVQQMEGILTTQFHNGEP